jgi:2-keto-4-pentenoate hydratase/2-oxohepta-3-ene-1,7-dioic acid hydratase in catechol pathway
LINDEILYGVVEGVSETGDITDETMVATLHGHPFGEVSPTGDVFPLVRAKLLAPVMPSKVIAVGLNYADHVKESGKEIPAEPMIFLKPSTSIIGPDEAIQLPWQSEHVDHEAELAIVIGRFCRDVPIERVPEVILGYTCANDVSARDLQKADGQWGRAKGFDTFCPLGPWISTSVDLDDARIACIVDGEVRQNGQLGDMIRNVPELVSWISSVMTLLPGDVILTGTPAGVGPLKAGQEVAVAIEGIGILSNPVVDRV